MLQTNKKNGKSLWYTICHSQIFKNKDCEKNKSYDTNYQASMQVDTSIKNSNKKLHSLKFLDEFGWYWGPLTWIEAEKQLKNSSEGSFLIRDSTDDYHLFTLSFKTNGKIFHFRLQNLYNYMDLIKNVKNSIWECLLLGNDDNNLFYKHSIKDLPTDICNNPPIPLALYLEKPLNRFNKAYSLKYVCRYKILSMINRDQLHELNIPDRLQAYLRDPRYLIE
ncbi:unnamed protein product [Gordionus sp. m RMFG-2023]|uniref:suppressor of cytokine signaling 6-like n=1 Tax=Gordionus sp. m RMFG-2023 TaxID=3053472 RepID=UPI0030E009ED